MPIQGPNFILPKTYRKLGYAFLIAGLACFGLIIYLGLSKVTIVIHSNIEKVNQEYAFDVVTSGQTGAGMINGKVVSAVIEEEKTFPSTGTQQTATDSDIVGEVTITNTSNKEQTLVATTRLAAAEAPDKVLVRLKNNVVIKPGEKVKAPVYADKPAEFIELAPMKFIFPGLWKPFWDKIYAENAEALVKGSRKVTVVTDQDVEEAVNNFKQELYNKGVEQINTQLGEQESLWARLAISKILDQSISPAAGQEGAEFSLKLKLEVVSVVFDETQVVNLIKENMKGAGDGKKTIDPDPKSFEYAVDSFDASTGQAHIKVKFAADAAMAGSDSLKDKTGILGKTEKEIKTYYGQFSEVRSVEVVFQPVWITVAPSDPNKIDIVFVTDK